MSEYQYYEFQAIDRPLTQGEMAGLRKISSRASITPSRFHNVYNYGDFGGDPLKLMERYFDAFVYVANWGTHRFMVRLPSEGFDLPTEPYQSDDEYEGTLLVHTRGDKVILEFVSQLEESLLWIDEEETAGWLPALLPLRAELAGGDARALYLAWLAGIYADEFEDEEFEDDEFDDDDLDDNELDGDVLEPPAPPGLGQLSTALTTLAEFLRLDEDLLAVAAEASPDLPAPPSAKDLANWVQTLPESEKDALLLQLAGDAPRAQAGLWRQFREATPPRVEALVERRRVADLLTAAKQHAEVRQRQEAAREAAEQARREQAAAAARTAHLETLTGREEALWHQVDALIQIARTKEYDQALQILVDLRDLSERDEQGEAFADRLDALRERYPNRRSLHDRLARAGLA